MRKPSAWRWTTIAVALAVVPARALSPTAEFSTGLMTIYASPSVQATIVTNDGSLELLVLWRGRPGWGFGEHRDSGGGTADGSVTVALVRGQVSLDMTFSPVTHTVSIQGHRKPVPPGSNVLFIDRVDDPRGPSLIGTATLDMAGQDVDIRSGGILPLFRKSPEVVAYLRCDLPAPPPPVPLPSDDARKLFEFVSKGLCDQVSY